jgi:hypothetical protein
VNEQETVIERIAVLETKVDHIDAKLDDSMRSIKDLFSVQYINLESRVKTLEAHITWLWQTVIVSVLGGLITLIVTLVK